MSKPAMRKGKPRSQENEVDDSETVDGHREGYDEVESVSSHHHHHRREPAGCLTASPEDVRRVRKEVMLEREQLQ